MFNIRDIINAATPGPWDAKCSGCDYPYVEHHGKDIASFDTIVNAIFIATFDPEHVALMDAGLDAVLDLVKCPICASMVSDYGHAVMCPLGALDTYRKEHGYG